MSDLIKISEAQLANVLKPTSGQLQKRLSAEDGLALTILSGQMQRRWPNQDRAESIDEYAADWERLIQKHGARALQDAVNALRIDPKREDFYPGPGEVAQEIERQWCAKRLERESEEREHRALQDAEYRAHLMSPDEIAWRIAHFGYDPFAQKLPTATK